MEVPSSQALSVTAAGVTLLSQLANMPSMSPLIASPVPSVGSVVPNIGTSSNTPPTTIIITTNGISQQTLEVSALNKVPLVCKCMGYCTAIITFWLYWWLVLFPGPCHFRLHEERRGPGMYLFSCA